MATKSIRLSELAALPAAEQETQLADLTRGCFEPLNGDADNLDRRIAEYETRYEMSSAAMLKLYEEQALRETEDICAWLMLLSLRERLGVKTSTLSAELGAWEKASDATFASFERQLEQA